MKKRAERFGIGVGEAIVRNAGPQAVEERQVEAAVSGQPHGRPYLARATNEAK